MIKIKEEFRKYRLKSIALPIQRVLALVMALCLSSAWANADETVHIENASRVTHCAEEDNVYVKLLGNDIRRLSIAAIHPAYMPQLQTDHMAADFTNCDMRHDPSFAFTPKDVTLFEDADYLLLGHTFKSFWRPNHVDFKVGATVTQDLHLVQLFRKGGKRPMEVLVVYPPDGYWRAKPLPPARFDETGYGSSFLVGPIEEERRPFVAFSSIEFVPKTVSFVLRFKGGEATLRVAQASQEGTVLDISLPPSSPGASFAAIRSMYVSDLQADTAIAETVDPSGQRHRVPVMDLKSADATSVTFLRSSESRHNTSAPDLRFGEFGR